MTPSLSVVLMVYAMIAAFVGWAMLHGMRDEPLRVWWVCVGFGVLWMPLLALALFAKLVVPLLDYVIERMEREDEP